MDKATALGQLRDIHLPAEVSWWPLAPGWYLLGLLMLLVAAAAYHLMRKIHQHKLAKKQALRLLANYEVEHGKTMSSQVVSARVSELLKRVALVYFPRQQVAGLQGEAWISFLNQTAKGVDFTSLSPILLELPYRKSTEGFDLKPLFVQCRLWITQRRKPCLS